MPPSQVLQRSQASESVQAESAQNTSSEQPQSLAQQAKIQSSIPSLEPSVMVKGKPRNHIPWKETLFGSPFDGRAGMELHEPIPEPFERPGDEIIKAKQVMHKYSWVEISLRLIG